jgi:dynein heavy chain
LQNYARRARIAIDKIGFQFRVLKGERHDPPAEGAHVRGMFLDGARWDSERGLLADPRPKELQSAMPIVRVS